MSFYLAKWVLLGILNFRVLHKGQPKENSFFCLRIKKVYANKLV